MGWLVAQMECRKNELGNGLFGNRGRAIRSGNVGGLIKLLY
jgi:hypothetical protein